ncbi:lysosome membrane protein 2-like isoform X1 [Vespula squamosa]|uniref:Scavenger receptor class B member 1 n=1 Tax=Vespula squamosa TaxID=30214 RepID=A0ABD2BSZ6_VESSQ
MFNVFEMKSEEKDGTIQRDQSNFLRNWYVWIISMMGLSSLFLLVIFWCTNIFQDTILSSLIIQKGTSSFDFWEHPPVKLIYKFYIFNYTNVEDFESGKANKLRVQQLGPYIYRETKKRVNLQIHENSTISYQEEKSYQWESGNPENETIVVPNIPLLAAISYFRNLHITAKLLLNVGLSTLNIKTFINLTVRDFLWGYDDNLYNILKALSSLKDPLPYERFGVLVASNGVSKDRITINTGFNDMNYLGIIEKINGKSVQNIWGDEKCDKIYGTDGSIFPPKWIDNYNTPLYIYVKELCKPLSFHFHEYGNVQGIPSLRYKMSMDSLKISSTDSCFCPKFMGYNSSERKCPPTGIFNVSACNSDLPILISLPNFYGADQSLIESIDGLKPNETLHESFLDLHQFLALPMNGSSKMQLNIEVRQALGMPYTGKMKDGMILPIMWYDNTLDILPQKFINIFFDAHFVTTIIERAFRWGSVLVFLISICALLITLRNHYIHRHVPLCEKVPAENKLIEG